MAQVATRDRQANSRLPAVDTILFALLAYLPFFFSSPGRLSSDTKQYLYLDPGRFLSRAPWLWDPNVAGGTVSHQHIGYLFPMGPFFWVFDQLGVPDWVAQRFWLGTISLAAALGARWLFRNVGVGRIGAAVGALVYVLSPYQLAFTARMSILLLPWAALPWIIGLTMRAARRGGWRDPALIALVVLTIGGVNASALVLVAAAPALWLGFEFLAGGHRARAALLALGRIATLATGVSLWWLAGIWVQGSYGLPVLQLTENVQTISGASSPGDVLRGLGNWFFYGRDGVGYSLIQARPYAFSRVVGIASYSVPALALLVGVLLRWRYRAYFAGCVVVGTVIAVGAWPFADPSPYGRIWKAFTDASSVGLALRNTPRVVPMVVLGVAGLIAAAVGAVTLRWLQRCLAAGIAALLAVALLPVWQHGFLTPGVERPNNVPAYWQQAIAAMDREPHDTRVLEIPGASFATYRWGNTVEPITPGLTSRPFVAREVLPYGSPESANLMDALDRRLQNGSFEAAALAPLARLLGVGTVAVRSDLAYERSNGPRPRLVWSWLTDPRAPGLGTPQPFGEPVRNAAPVRDAIDQRIPSNLADPPPVALFPIKDPVPIVRTATDRNPVVLSGDGDGIVDAAAARLLTGRERVLQLAALDRAALDHSLDTGAALVLTDSNRRRINSWFSSIRDTKGATEPAGETNRTANGYDTRLGLFADDRDTARTVVEQSGAQVRASADGGPDRPEDRAAAAFDGDVRTTWRVGGTNPTGSIITVRPHRSVRADHINVVQSLALPRDRWITRVRIQVPLAKTAIWTRTRQLPT